MGALSHLRIVEIGSAAATSYCARLFADFGATVSKIEPPEGDPLRRAAPLTPKGQSAWFAFLNFNKSSIALDSKDANAASRLSELIERCDILIDGRDVDAANCPAVDIAAIKQRHPGLIHLEASWFGGEGPYAQFEATDSTIRALTGLIKLVGPVEGPPMHAPDFQTGIFAGLWGFIAAASSVLGRMQDGRGRTSSLSIFESSIAVTEYIMFEVVRARRHHAADRRQPVLADLSGRHLRDQTRLAWRHHGYSRAVARLLRDAGSARAARRSEDCSWASTGCSTWGNRKQDSFRD